MFKVFVLDAGHSDDGLRLAREVETFTKDGKVAVKSVGVEYLEARKQIVLSLGYRDDEPGYPAKLGVFSLGKLGLEAGVIEKAMGEAAARVENVICHEFFVNDLGEFVMVLLSHG